MATATATATATVFQTSQSFSSAFTARRPPPSSQPPPRFPNLRHNGGAPLIAKTSSRCSTVATSVAKFSNGRYTREDYLEKVSAEQVQELLKGERTVPLVIDFYATWCGPCILMAQELEMLAVEYESNVQFVKVDTDDEYDFAQDMQIRGLPALYFISPDPNKDAIRTEGLIPKEMIKNIIDNEM